MRFFVTKALTLLDSTFTQTACIFVVNLLIVCRLVKAESTISGHNEQCISHLILLAHLIGKCMKVPVDVSADNHAFRFRIFKQFAHNNSPITRN